MTDRSAEIFTGFGTKVIDWFRGLEKDNSKAYFDTTRDIWESEIRDPLEALLQEAATHVGGDVKLFRPNRDVRFSKDKSPYKSSTYGVVRPESSAAGLFASISANGFYAGTGYYRMATDQLERFRDAVASESSGSLLVTIVQKAEDNDLTIEGASLKSAPRGYPRDHPRIELLRMKEMIYGAFMSPGDHLHDRHVFDFAMSTWRTAQPLTMWLDKHVGSSNLGEASKFGR
ncbi:DUF2461 domain-containing protein [soil metagenome]